MQDSGEIIEQDERYAQAATDYGAAIDRLARAYEAHAEVTAQT